MSSGRRRPSGDRARTRGRPISPSAGSARVHRRPGCYHRRVHEMDAVDPVGRSLSVVVTNAQRARLVVALGLLNLILATVALTAGLVAPAPTGPDVAQATTTPASGSEVPAGSPQPTGPAASGSPIETSASPGSSESTPPESAAPSPSVEPSASPAASGPIVAEGPTPTPGSVASTPPLLHGGGRTPPPSPIATPQPTPRPTPRPTPKPTVRPTPAPTPAPNGDKAKKPRPPCPSADAGPPGHNKTAPSPSRPCGSKGAGHGQGSNGIVFVLPLALAGAAVGGGRRRIAETVRRVRRRARGGRA
jgi:hypothetical protein